MICIAVIVQPVQFTVLTFSHTEEVTFRRISDLLSETFLVLS